MAHTHRGIAAWPGRIRALRQWGGDDRYAGFVRGTIAISAQAYRKRDPSCSNKVRRNMFWDAPRRPVKFGMRSVLDALALIRCQLVTLECRLRIGVFKDIFPKILINKRTSEYPVQFGVGLWSALYDHPPVGLVCRDGWLTP